MTPEQKLLSMKMGTHRCECGKMSYWSLNHARGLAIMLNEDGNKLYPQPCFKGTGFWHLTNKRPSGKSSKYLLKGVVNSGRSAMGVATRLESEQG